MTEESDPTSASTSAPPGYRYASPWIRFVALIIDGLVLAALFFLAFLAAAIVFDLVAPLPAGADPWFVSIDLDRWPAGAVVYVASSALMFAWYGGWQAGAGATPGMFAVQLRVRGATGEANPTFGAAATRNAPQILTNFGAVTGVQAIDTGLTVITLLVLLVIGITISNSHTRQGFHDRLAGTYVVRPARAPAATENGLSVRAKLEHVIARADRGDRGRQ